MAVMERISAGPIRVIVEANESALTRLGVGGRNRVLRVVMVRSLERWRREFLPLRFTRYAERQPFGYQLHGGAAWMRWMQTEHQRFIKAWYGGWDPFGDQPANRSPQFATWLRAQQQQGKFRYSLSGKLGGAQAEYRANAKKFVREAFRRWWISTRHLPLVLTGELRDLAMTGRVTATATATRGVRGTVTIPRGNRQNPQAVKILGTLPTHEVATIARWFRQELENVLAGSPGSTLPGPALPPGRQPPPPRAMPRAIPRAMP